MLDQKHLVIEAPAESHTLYRNYKGTFSIAVLSITMLNIMEILEDIH